MAATRYRESRTLVRRLVRLPGQDRESFKRQVSRLRDHFQRFNVDASELCQWLMGLRKQFGPTDAPASFGVLGDFTLSPALNAEAPPEPDQDRWRLAVFDAICQQRPLGRLGQHPVPDELRQAMKDAAALTPTPTTTRLFERLRTLEPAHRMVLLKAAAEWITGRYVRGMENWVRQRDAWEKEKTRWEAAHPELTVEVRERYEHVYRALSEPNPGGTPGPRRRNPRICLWERLKQNIDNCCYAGEKGHGPLCWKYDRFVKAQEEASEGRFNKKRFWEDAQRLVAYCAEKKFRPSKAFLSPHLPNILFKDKPSNKRDVLCRQLKENWAAYLKHMELSDDTIVERGRLPHCQKIGEVYEKSACEWNPHTDLCLRYKRLAGQLDDATLALEKTYREWRRLYRAGPRKPSFRYPSSRHLPMPKIFGAGFHEIDFERCIVRLRLDDMPAGEWIEYGFTPWPRKYSPSRREIAQPGRVTSVHVHFVGTRPRVGFRFDVPHAPSRFALSQDDLDELRSRVYPLAEQNEQFLEAARDRLLKSFDGDAERELRLLAVDTGEKGATASLFVGRVHQLDEALPIIKINALYTSMPDELTPDRHGRPAKRQFKEAEDPRGVSKEHVARHLEQIATKSKEAAAYRQAQAEKAGVLSSVSPRPVTERAHDCRSLKRHVSWMIRDWARHNASRILDLAERHRCDLIVFESRRGNRPPGYHQVGSEAERKKLDAATFAYGRIRRKVTEKAVERGMRVITVPDFKSSQVCSSCGRVQENTGLLRKNKKERKFICEHCSHQVNSDANASRVLARVFWGEVRLPPREEKQTRRATEHAPREDRPAVDPAVRRRENLR